MNAFRDDTFTIVIPGALLFATLLLPYALRGLGWA